MKQTFTELGTVKNAMKIHRKYFKRNFVPHNSQKKKSLHFKSFHQNTLKNILNDVPPVYLQKKCPCLPENVEGGEVEVR